MSMVLARPDTRGLHVRPRACVGVSGATVSHHLKQLPDAGLIEGTRKGTNVSYRARLDTLGRLCRVIDPSCC